MGRDPAEEEALSGRPPAQSGAPRRKARRDPFGRCGAAVDPPVDADDRLLLEGLELQFAQLDAQSRGFPLRTFPLRRVSPGSAIPVHHDDYRVFRSPLSAFVEAALRTPLLFEPGSRYGYSSMGILLAAEIAQHEARRVPLGALPVLADGRYALFHLGPEPKDWMIHRMDPPEDPDREPMPEVPDDVDEDPDQPELHPAAGHAVGREHRKQDGTAREEHQRAQQEGFREIFVNPSDIGGRFSALSFFGAMQ